MQEEFFYNPDSLLELNQLLRYLDKYQTPIIDREILNAEELHINWNIGDRLCVVANLLDGSFTFSLVWNHASGSKISLKQIRMLAHIDAYPRAYDEFSYKFELMTPEEEIIAKSLIEELGFVLIEDSREEDSRIFLSICVDNEGNRTYRIDSCEFSFFRNNSFVSTDFEHFVDIVWLINLLEREDKLIPIDMQVGIFA